MEVILTHDHADFDAVAAMLAAHKLRPGAVPVLPPTLNRNVAEFLALYGGVLPFTGWRDFEAEMITHLTLVDTQHVPSLKGMDAATTYAVIDHHPQGSQQPGTSYHLEDIGATTTILIEQLQTRGSAGGLAVNALEATLLALGIYEDTGSLTYNRTTPRDVRAAALLLQHGADLDKLRRFLSPPLNDEQRDLFEQLMPTLETRTLQGATVTVGTARVDSHIDQINSVARRIREIVDSAVLFVAVQMPHSIQIVARSNRDMLDVGAVMQAFGGGGHARAAAANIEAVPLGAVIDRLWTEVARHMRPVIRVADLMSHGVQLVSAEARLEDVIPQLRRIGHEGYPVTATGHGDTPVIGLLTRRDADRAWEHGLHGVRVRDVMQSGAVNISPDADVGLLEKRMVDTGWGQIPVVNDAGLPVGIVTRTDLLHHWASTHPDQPPPPPRLDRSQIRAVMGEPAAALIARIAEHAQLQSESVYLVGGVVRDLLLKRPNFDIDFVVERDAIAFAESLSQALGGEISPYAPFRTAKWRLTTAVLARLNVNDDELPDHIDFATARYEFYTHPTALPTVYNSSIKLDLHRRDFTINTLAVQLSPAALEGRLLDFYGGLEDLEAGRIRVLHSLSFIDDPTRILRAVRFEQRLGFHIEARTAELIQTAFPMLKRITGERLRNELNLLIREREPEKGLLALHERGILAAIHPAFVIDPQVEAHFKRARDPHTAWPVALPDRLALYWHIALSVAPLDALGDLCERLLINKQNAGSLIDAATLRQQPGILREPATRASQVTERLDGVSETALLAVWLVAEETLIQDTIARYLTTWRHIDTQIDGNALKAMGLPPGPGYRSILKQLRTARLDGDITTEDGERSLAKQLVREALQHDSD